MALFSRKHRPHDEDVVSLTSTDHLWWTGEAVPADDVVVEAELLDSDGWDDGEAEAEATPAAAIADALEEFGYGRTSGNLLSLPGPDDPAPVAAGPDGHPEGRRRDDDTPAPSTSPTATGMPAPLDEAALFSRDGLPDEDRLLDHLGTLGLEQDAGWVDIARAHRRLAPPTTGRDDGDDECQRRAANEAYACLRLFHH